MQNRSNDVPCAQEALPGSSYVAGCMFPGLSTLLRPYAKIIRDCVLRISGNRVDTLYKIARAGKSKTNALRNLMTVMNTQNVMLPVEMDAIRLTITKKKPKVRTLQVWWPVLKMSDWVSMLLVHHPQVLLCGYTLHDYRWMDVLEEFWRNFRLCEPGHEIFCNEHGSRPLRCCVPYYIHGDEGRFLRNKPLMIEAFQPAISHKGMAWTNESGLLGTCILQPVYFRTV